MPTHLRRFGAAMAALAVVAAACTAGAPVSDSEAVPTTSPPDTAPPAPLDPELEALLLSVADPVGESITSAALDEIVAFGDPRVAWAIADLMRFHQVGEPGTSLVAAANALTGLELDPASPIGWVVLTNQLLVDDVPSGEWLREFKAKLFGTFEPEWKQFFEDEDADVDWRTVSWGGVLPDRRELDSAAQCFCIPALDHPGVTPAEGGDWYQPQRIVFGVVVNGEARAYPRNIMETHELVNDTLGGREIAIPYCTLCGAAQAFFVDGGEERLVMRTSGLLRRSNKIMYDLVSGSYFDTFGGVAVSGPLQGLQLEQISVVTSTWRDWKEAHPDTTIVAEDGGIGRAYEDEPLGGRDLGGPIFPVGTIDERLGASVQVLGFDLDGQPWAVPVIDAVEYLEAGGTIMIGSADVLLDGSGLVVVIGSDQVISHQAFWFAWSQFNPTTQLWQPKPALAP